jgi:hypothetical protein
MLMELRALFRGRGVAHVETGNDSEMAPQAIEIAQNGLGLAGRGRAAREGGRACEKVAQKRS